MDHLSHSQVTETYMTSGLSLFCVCLFIFIKYNHFWSRERHLICLIFGWGLLQLTALILFGLEHSKRSKLPDLLARPLHTILATISMWGVAIIQIIAITYPFAIAIRKEPWLKWIAILQCVEVMLIVILAMIPNISTPVELAYIAPLTSQAAVIGVVFISSRGIYTERVPKHTAYHLLFLALLLVLISALVFGLSLTGYYEKLIFPQWLLYMIISTVGYRLPENEHQGPRQTNGDSELELVVN
ncbi:hypothetical protein DER44DRAFT_869526 [Fusarium oxysporum]|nr:hypothetical protein DER44DRAFT_869526 [Fusarium oxysporum]